MPDSPEELRQRVDELESTIRGLTQELVEANERIRQLEEKLEARPETIVAGDGEDGEDAGSEASTKPLGTAMETDPESATDAGSAIESDTPAEDTEGSTEETDDIIVA